VTGIVEPAMLPNAFGFNDRGSAAEWSTWAKANLEYRSRGNAADDGSRLELTRSRLNGNRHSNPQSVRRIYGDGGARACCARGREVVGGSQPEFHEYPCGIPVGWIRSAPRIVPRKVKLHQGEIEGAVGTIVDVLAGEGGVANHNVVGVAQGGQP